MHTGDIYYFSTDKARGYEQRSKYHLFVCAGEWRDEGEHVFLFINKSNGYGGGFELRRDDGYPFFPLEKSYIACTSTVSYTSSYGDKVGCLQTQDIPLFLNHIQTSEVMESYNISRICAALHLLKAARSETKK